MRWLQDGEHRSRTFSDYTEARKFNLKMQSLKLEGRLRSAPRITLDEFAERKWFPEYVSRLATATRINYGRAWYRHVAPRVGISAVELMDAERWEDDQKPSSLPDSLGARRLRDLSNAVVREFATELEKKTGPWMARTTLMVLSSCLTHAVEVDYLDANPVRAIKKTRQSRLGKAVRPLPPSEVEKLHAALLVVGARGRRDAAFVSLLSYCGLRPGEALALRWGDVREKTIHVHQSISYGTAKEPKNRKARSALLLPVLREELAELRSAVSGRDDDLLFGRGDGEPLLDTDYRNWRRRVFLPAVERSGIRLTHPYALRHSWASLLLRSEDYGSNPARIAETMGHSVGTFFRVYAHEIEELRDAPRISPEAEIRDARAAASGQLRLLAH
ncbi:MAG TPA: site-specific integrase [Gaiellaceae bacterium]|nr:site-specific integrase [Gaiellaceae bacterium]